jgi:hypothetical protein
MPSDDWGVAKVKGVKPEHFFIFLINSHGFKGPFMRTSDFLSEDSRANFRMLANVCLESSSRSA